MNKIDLAEPHNLDTQIAAMFKGDVTVCNGCLLLFKDDTLCIDAYLNAFRQTPEEADEMLLHSVIDHAKQTLSLLQQACANLTESLDGKQVIYRCIYMDWMKPVNVALESNGEFVRFEHD